jgi:tRNA A-37 threonylcarbamoyl transferase component Bud32
VTADFGSRSDSLGRSAAFGRIDGDTGLRHTSWAFDRPVPDAIGRYVLIGQVAGGGMGSVFVAQMRGSAGFSRLVAIKCLHTRWLDDPKYIARFTTEVKLTTLIRHPNVVQALDVVEDGGELFLVMEYVDGVTLAALLADLGRCERQLSVGVALGVVAAVLRGLHAAHRATDESGAPCHIVHRDVSPQNIMVSRNGHVLVLDFGAAKSAEHSQQTAAGVLVGKLAYMAPEQVRGERSSPRSDVFSAGVVLWEALIGKRLFHDPTRSRGELMHALVLKPVERPSQLRAEVPPAVDEVVRRALERDPEHRFQTALEFAEALEAAGAVVSGAALGELVGEVCAERLAEKDALLRSGLRLASAAAPGSREASTPSSHALAVPARSRSSLTLVAPAASRRSLTAWLGAAGVIVAVAWWAFVSLRYGEFFELANRSIPASVASSSSSSEPTPSTRAGADPSSARPSPEAPTATAPPSAQALVVELPIPVQRRRASPSAAGRPRRADGSTFAHPQSSSPRDRRSAERRDCDSPTYMDAVGIRHFKKDCL